MAILGKNIELCNTRHDSALLGCWSLPIRAMYLELTVDGQQSKCFDIRKKAKNSMRRRGFNEYYSFLQSLCMFLRWILLSILP